MNTFEIDHISAKMYLSHLYFPGTLLEKFWRILLFVTDDAISKLYVTVRFRQIEGNSRKFRHIELNISVTSKIF